MPGKLLRGRTCGSTGPQRGGPAVQCSLKIIQEFSETSFSDTAVIIGYCDTVGCHNERFVTIFEHFTV